MRGVDEVDEAQEDAAEENEYGAGNGYVSENEDAAQMDASYEEDVNHANPFTPAEFWQMIYQQRRLPE